MGFLDNFDMDQFIAEAEALLGRDGSELAENVAENLLEPGRQTRNRLNAAIENRSKVADIVDGASTELTPKQERDLEASFKAHLKALQRGLADEVGQKLKSTEFMGVIPDKEPVILTMDEYAENRLANLGPHPHSEQLAIPIPKGYEKYSKAAAKIVNLPPDKRQSAFHEAMKSFGAESVE